MDPYLEAHWGGVYTRLMVYASNQLNAQLPDDLQARVEGGVAIRAEDEPRPSRHLEIVDVSDDGRLVGERGGEALPSEVRRR